MDAGRGARAVEVADRGGASVAAAVAGGGAADAGGLLGATLGVACAAGAIAGVSALTCPAGSCVGALLPVSMYTLQAMKPIMTARPAMQNLNQKPLLLASGSGIGRECTVRGASKRLSPGAAPDAVTGVTGGGIGAVIGGGKGARVGARVDAIDGSAPSRAAHASQKRAPARLRWPHSGQAMVDDLGLDIALHCA